MTNETSLRNKALYKVTLYVLKNAAYDNGIFLSNNVCTCEYYRYIQIQKR